MTMTPVLETHIYRDEKGTVYVDTPRNKVKMLVQSVQSYGGVDATAVAFPHLTLAQLHAAMSYYYDHQAEIDEAIREGKEFAEKLRLATPESPATTRVRDAMARNARETP
jgi:uncharacterized protein (DUF433 family)